MKRFLLFAGLDYYPQGGWEDFAGDYATSTEAIKAAANRDRADWWHIVDTQAEPPAVIESGERSG